MMYKFYKEKLIIISILVNNRAPVINNALRNSINYKTRKMLKINLIGAKMPEKCLGFLQE